MSTYALGYKEDSNPAWQLLAVNRQSREELEFNILRFEGEAPPSAQLVLLEMKDDGTIEELLWWDSATSMWRDIGTKSLPKEFWYLATPYAKYPEGLEAAFAEACHQTLLLKQANISTYSPIVHCHPLERLWREAGHHLAADMGRFWLTMNIPIMDSARGLIVCKLESWQQSAGIQWEIKRFKSLRKPIIEMEPDKLPAEFNS